MKSKQRRLDIKPLMWSKPSGIGRLEFLKATENFNKANARQGVVFAFALFAGFLKD